MLPIRAALATVSILALAAPFTVRAQSARSPRDTTPNHEPPASAPKASAPAIDFSGVIFGNSQFQTDSTANAADGGKNPNRFDIERVYLTFKMPAGDRAAIRVTTDIKQRAGDGFYDGWFVRLKYAYLQYSILRPTESGLSALARVGALHTVLIDHEERFWPRYLGKVAVDRAGFFSSSDLGASAQLTFPHEWGEVAATLTNGPAYESPEADRFKDLAFRISVTPLMQASGLLRTVAISPWVYVGKTASKFATDSITPITSSLARNRWGVFVGNRDPRLTFGVEYAQRTDGTEAGATPLARTVRDVTGRLYDAFAIVRPLAWANPTRPSSVGAVFRLDDFDPSTETDGRTQFVTAGLFWEPTTSTALALDYQRTRPLNGQSGAAASTWYLHWQANF